MSAVRIVLTTADGCSHQRDYVLESSKSTVTCEYIEWCVGNLVALIMSGYTDFCEPADLFTGAAIGATVVDANERTFTGNASNDAITVTGMSWEIL